LMAPSADWGRPNTCAPACPRPCEGYFSGVFSSAAGDAGDGGSAAGEAGVTAREAEVRAGRLRIDNLVTASTKARASTPRPMS
jgi:hypothetical protein